MNDEKKYIVSITKDFMVNGKSKKEVLEHFEEKNQSTLDYSISIEVEEG